MERPWDCIVIGGGAAGLSAALVLGRARRRTLLVDDGRQSNLAAHGIGGLLGHDGRPPAELYAAARAELARYPSVELVTGTVVSAERAEEGFLVAVPGGVRYAARRLLLATGMDYRAPDVPGVAERWGRSVFHCPFCHGWEVRDRPLGVLDRGADAVHRALLLRAWSDDVTVLTDGPPELDDDASAQLAAAGVAVDERRVAALRGPGSELTDVVFTDGSARSLGGLLVPVVLHQRSPLAARLGATIAPPGMLAADAVDVDTWLQTSVPGVAAAGDITGTMPSVANAIAAGSNAAAAIVRSLVVEPPPAE
jgi:thioredoxin reductase